MRVWQPGGRGARPERHSHTVQDEAQEHEHIVALVVLHVAYEALAQLAQVAGPREAPLVHEGTPGPDGRTAPLQPLTARAGRNQFRQQGPGGCGARSAIDRDGTRTLEQEEDRGGPDSGVLGKIWSQTPGSPGRKGLRAQTPESSKRTPGAQTHVSGGRDS